MLNVLLTKKEKLVKEMKDLEKEVHGVKVEEKKEKKHNILDVFAVELEN